MDDKTDNNQQQKCENETSTSLSLAKIAVKRAAQKRFHKSGTKKRSEAKKMELTKVALDPKQRKLFQDSLARPSATSTKIDIVFF